MQPSKQQCRTFSVLQISFFILCCTQKYVINELGNYQSKQNVSYEGRIYRPQSCVDVILQRSAKYNYTFSSDTLRSVTGRDFVVDHCHRINVILWHIDYHFLSDSWLSFTSGVKVDVIAMNVMIFTNKVFSRVSSSITQSPHAKMSSLRVL